MFNFKKVTTTNRETEVLSSGIETWVVEWRQALASSLADYPYSKPAYQIFINKDDAIKLQQSLEQAFKLIGSTWNTTVKLYKKDYGL